MLEEDVNLAERLGRDPSAHLDLIRLAARAEELTGDLLKGAVLGARSAGNTWEVIGQVLGMSRQAAQQRFGNAVSRRSASAGSPARTSGASSTAAVTEA
jgi:hypothetical protein